MFADVIMDYRLNRINIKAESNIYLHCVKYLTNINIDQAHLSNKN
jgi:hypothetical protein